MAEEIYRVGTAVALATGAAQGLGAANGAAIPVGAFAEAVALLNVTAVSGTAPTLDVKFQTTDNPTAANPVWYDLGSAFAQQVAVATPAGLKLTNFGPWLRAITTVGGSATPTVAFTLTLVLKS